MVYIAPVTSGQTGHNLERLWVSLRSGIENLSWNILDDIDGGRARTAQMYEIGM
jgi:hypothetical protein